MKKLLSVTVAVIFAGVVLTGCKSTGQVQNEEWKAEFKNAPSWVLNPEAEEGISAAGSAKLGKAGMSFAKVEALANGRDEVARIMSIKVKNMVKNFTQVTGIGDDQVVDKVSSNVSKQLASQVLSGSRQKNLWISPGGTLYVLVVLDTASVKDAVKKSVNTSYKNEKALWQQFQSKKAQDELAMEVDKEFSE